jgi:hypothetical protein
LNFATAGGIGWNRVSPAPPPETSAGSGDKTAAF